MPEWMLYSNFILNLLIIPLLKVLWDIKIELTRLNGKLDSHDHRLGMIERRHGKVE